ncbi:hypothetical protein THRCLA_21948 [Thraustotheca clavata]|uniref:Uncharacterized protein n=1 Tax=Thraustotheca clavata TaxID=74557 RepID=A0A1V9ZH73_9STRA|nr:hypothetical protein THRCLA_21948 [Thraustotheca clavata]
MVKIYKMLLHWGIMFTVPTAIALTVFKPLDEDSQREMLEKKYKTDIDRAKKNRHMFKELLLPTEEDTEGKKISDEVTDRWMKGDPKIRPPGV